MADVISVVSNCVKRSIMFIHFWCDGIILNYLPNTDPGLCLGPLSIIASRQSQLTMKKFITYCISTHFRVKFLKSICNRRTMNKEKTESKNEITVKINKQYQQNN